MELSRRSFFKRSLLAAGSGSAVAFASGSARAEADCLKKPYKLESVKEVTNICCYCSGGCGTICSSRNGELINLEGDPDHPVNLGGLCPKGAAMWGLRNIVNPDRTVSAHPDRVIYPMVRRPVRPSGNVSHGTRPPRKLHATSKRPEMRALWKPKTA